MGGRSGEGHRPGGDGSCRLVGLAVVEEVQYVNGRWVLGRRLNGDETPEWRGLCFQGDRYAIQKIKLYRYR